MSVIKIEYIRNELSFFFYLEEKNKTEKLNHAISRNLMALIKRHKIMMLTAKSMKSAGDGQSYSGLLKYSGFTTKLRFKFENNVFFKLKVWFRACIKGECLITLYKTNDTSIAVHSIFCQEV